LRLFSFGGYGLALAALALVVFGAYDSYPHFLPLVFDAGFIFHHATGINGMLHNLVD